MFFQSIQQFEECGGIGYLEGLEYHANETIRTQANEMLETYFLLGDEEVRRFLFKFHIQYPSSVSEDFHISPSSAKKNFLNRTEDLIKLWSIWRIIDNLENLIQVNQIVKKDFIFLFLQKCIWAFYLFAYIKKKLLNILAICFILHPFENLQSLLSNYFS